MEKQGNEGMARYGLGGWTDKVGSAIRIPPLRDKVRTRATVGVEARAAQPLSGTAPSALAPQGAARDLARCRSWQPGGLLLNCEAEGSVLVVVWPLS